MVFLAIFLLLSDICDINNSVFLSSLNYSLISQHFRPSLTNSKDSRSTSMVAPPM